jgi:PHD/YefM family antitoxin component YafN of YafNO toxin-antitoxin module
MTKEFDQSTESRFWQSKALEVAEEIDEQWQLVMSTLRSKPNTYLISEDYYHMVREMKQVMKKYKMI